MPPNQPLAGPPNRQRGLVSVLFHSLERTAACGQFAKAALAVNDAPLAAFFDTAGNAEQGVVDRAEALLASRVGQPGPARTTTDDTTPGTIALPRPSPDSRANLASLLSHALARAAACGLFAQVARQANDAELALFFEQAVQAADEGLARQATTLLSQRLQG